jgi:hypothetical protein
MSQVGRAQLRQGTDPKAPTHVPRGRPKIPVRTRWLPPTPDIPEVDTTQNENERQVMNEERITKLREFAATTWGMNNPSITFEEDGDLIVAHEDHFDPDLLIGHHTDDGPGQYRIGRPARPARWTLYVEPTKDMIK